MLTYENVTIGQRVEVLHNEQVLYGTVLYKGPVMGRAGLWLGIDLTTPDGDNDGCLKGRVYFRAPLNYGLFTTIEHVRLASNVRRKYENNTVR
jgi:dynactin complex subunit